MNLSDADKQQLIAAVHSWQTSEFTAQHRRKKLQALHSKLGKPAFVTTDHSSLGGLIIVDSKCGIEAVDFVDPACVDHPSDAAGGTE